MPPASILFVSKGETAASTRYRALDYFPYLRQADWEPSHLTAKAGPRGYWALLSQARRADVVVFMRRTANWPLLRLLRRCTRRLVFDFDDAVFARHGELRSAGRWRRFVGMVRACDMVWAGNHYLAQRALGFNPVVQVLPTSVEPAKYNVPIPQPTDYLDLVWVGSQSTRPYLQEALPVLEQAAARVPNLRLKILADFDLPAAKLPTLPVAWSSDGEADALASAHVGIAPMPDDPWTRGKCGCKVLQYMAAGLPVVASAAGVHPELVADRQTGFLVRSPADWVEAIVRLASDAALRQRMGGRGKRRASEQFSLATTFGKMQQALETLRPRNGN